MARLRNHRLKQHLLHVYCNPTGRYMQCCHDSSRSVASAAQPPVWLYIALNMADCSTSVCSCESEDECIWSAPGFVLSKENEANFKKKVYRYWRAHNYPKMSKETRWRVHLAKPTKWYKWHHAILIQSVETGEYFKLEVFISRQEVVLRSRWFDPSGHDDLNFTELGEVTLSACHLLKKALECAEEFGDYNMLLSNCQNYCQVLGYIIHSTQVGSLGSDSHTPTIFINKLPIVIYSINY